MSRVIFVAVCVVITSGVIAAMWFGWRSRAGRDAHSAGVASHALRGAVLERFDRASYVSTTPVGAPFERVVIPGLGFKGFAEVTVRTDGVEIAVTGEQPVAIPAARLLGTATAGRRVGKAVENDGLSLLRWCTPDDERPRDLESSFRFPSIDDQIRFADAIARVEPELRRSA